MEKSKSNYLLLVIKRYVVLFLCSFLVIFAWCQDYNQSYDFKIKVDTFAFPQSWVNHGDTLLVAFWGTIGTDTCSSFSKFQITQDSSRAEIIVWGHKSVIYRQGCSSANVLLNGKKCSLFPVKQGTYTVIVDQPDGSKIQQQIWIH